MFSFDSSLPDADRKIQNSIHRVAHKEIIAAFPKSHKNAREELCHMFRGTFTLEVRQALRNSPERRQKARDSWEKWAKKAIKSVEDMIGSTLKRTDVVRIFHSVGRPPIP